VIKCALNPNPFLRFVRIGFHEQTHGTDKPMNDPRPMT